jgi:hypothetical protein
MSQKTVQYVSYVNFKWWCLGWGISVFCYTTYDYDDGDDNASSDVLFTDEFKSSRDCLHVKNYYRPNITGIQSILQGQ